MYHKPVFTELVKQYSPLVERLGFDENFVDVTDLVSSPKWHKEMNNKSVVGHIYGEDENGMLVNNTKLVINC